MDDLVFKKRYSKVYSVLKDLPEDIISKYGISQDMTRQEAIEQLRDLNKKKIYEFIDLIPDAVVAQQFRQYLLRHKAELEKLNILGQINIFWFRITRSTAPPVHKPEK
ncbi:MAG: hypothetical protein NT033_04135 [Candidatus Omnitrophica bacterium]|nr:hypothetical protein [Candidatus Omnitrophota bacterium]